MTQFLNHTLFVEFKWRKNWRKTRICGTIGTAFKTTLINSLRTFYQCCGSGGLLNYLASWIRTTKFRILDPDHEQTNFRKKEFVIVQLLKVYYVPIWQNFIKSQNDVPVGSVAFRIRISGTDPQIRIRKKYLRFHHCLLRKKRILIQGDRSDPHLEGMS